VFLFHPGMHDQYYVFRMFVCNLRYSECNAHAPYYILICGLSCCNIFFHITSWKEGFLGNKLVNLKCVVWFSLHLLSETFLSLRRTERDMIKQFICLQVQYRYYCQISIKLEFYRLVFEKYSNTKFNENPSNKNQFVPCRWKGTETDGHDLTNSRFFFLQFCEYA
jgi:hypothetical protein